MKELESQVAERDVCVLLECLPALQTAHSPFACRLHTPSPLRQTQVAQTKQEMRQQRDELTQVPCRNMFWS